MDTSMKDKSIEDAVDTELNDRVDANLLDPGSAIVNQRISNATTNSVKKSTSDKTATPVVQTKVVHQTDHTLNLEMKKML